jgi:hypothetical protein
MRSHKLVEDIPTFCIEVETVEPVPNILRVKLVWAPDDEGESKTYWVENPLNGEFANEEELGQALFISLFGNDDSNEIGRRFKHYYHLNCVDKIGQKTCLRILLSFSSVKGRADSSASLPWELLRMGSTWLSRDAPISIARRTTTKEPNRQKNNSSLRVLLTFAEPEVLERFNGDAHLKEIEQIFGKEISWLDLVLLPHANRDTLRQKIREGFHIVHFLGHGEAKPSAATGLDAFLYLENPDMPSKSDKISANTIASWFQDAKLTPRLVILMACQSGISDRFAVLGTAQALLASGVSAVVAFQAMLRVQEAGKFAARFYRTLASSNTVDDAVYAGRGALDDFSSTLFRRGTEESIARMLKPKSLRLEQLDDMRKIIDVEASSTNDDSLEKSQTVKFPAWAIPILLLNGDSRLGQEPPPPSIYWKLADPDTTVEMVYIPEGDFYIDKYPVTYSDYTRFFPNWSRPKWATDVGETDYSDFPAVNLTFQDAQKYAQLTGRLLPSVQEWKQAALSGLADKTQKYPWGNEFNEASPCCHTRESDPEHLRPISVKDEAVRFPENRNPSGMCGIIGNVAEFAMADDGPRVCGGSYKERGRDISIQKPQIAPTRATPATGFRCIAGWLEIKSAQRSGTLPATLVSDREGSQAILKP